MKVFRLLQIIMVLVLPLMAATTPIVTGEKSTLLLSNDSLPFSFSTYYTYHSHPLYNITHTTTDKHHDKITVSTTDILFRLGWKPLKRLLISADIPFHYDRLSDFESSIGSFGFGDLKGSFSYLLISFDTTSQFNIILNGDIGVPTGDLDGGIIPRYTTYDTKIKSLYGRDGFLFSPSLTALVGFGQKSNMQYPWQLSVAGGSKISSVSEQKQLAFLRTTLYWHVAHNISLFNSLYSENSAELLEGDMQWGKFHSYIAPGASLLLNDALKVTFLGSVGLGDRKNYAREVITSSESAMKEYLYDAPSSADITLSVGLQWKIAARKREIDTTPSPAIIEVPLSPVDSSLLMGEKLVPIDTTLEPFIEIDSCDTLTEDFDGFQDDDDCPEWDNDGDSILDSLDLCPNDSEDFDGIDDGDGCPDLDSDFDGIVDEDDKCPQNSEDFDGFKDDDGCPDLDNDMDGLADLLDHCPNKNKRRSSNGNGYGCLEYTKNGQILHGVVFRPGKTEMSSSSYVHLESLLQELKKYPKRKIEVRGYTDSSGKYKVNVGLSEKRATSVQTYLISKGITQDRIEVKGFGPNDPVADNRTSIGRRKNRRIEIIRK